MEDGLSGHPDGCIQGRWYIRTTRAAAILGVSTTMIADKDKWGVRTFPVNGGVRADFVWASEVFLAALAHRRWDSDDLEVHLNTWFTAGYAGESVRQEIRDMRRQGVRFL